MVEDNGRGEGKRKDTTARSVVEEKGEWKENRVAGPPKETPRGSATEQ